MAHDLTGSVGRGGKNRSADIKRVQELLNTVPRSKGGPSPLLETDGRKGGRNWIRTYDQISLFQFANFGWQDGRVDPGGKSFRKLVDYEKGAAGNSERTGQAANLSGSVGNQGQNRRDDVRRVQRILNAVPRRAGGPRQRLAEDGATAGNNWNATILAIMEFQSKQLNFRDGRIDVNGRTWGKLSPYEPDAERPAAPPAPPPAPPAPRRNTSPPMTDDGRVQAWIDRAYREMGSMGGNDQMRKNQFAWSYLITERKKSHAATQDIYLAAAEHYLYARFESSTGILGSGMMIIGVGLYDLVKATPGMLEVYNWYLRKQGERPASRPTWLSTKWGAQGLADGTADYMRGAFS
jgi:hypothetical protein